MRVALRAARRRRLADEWALVLTAVGIAARIERAAGGYAVTVHAEDEERARAALLAYERENPPPRATLPAEAPAPGSFHLGLLWAAALLAFFSVTGPRAADVAWFARGSADAARIADGELWRTVTALTLHADLAHVFSNAVVGAFFVGLLVRTVGAGAALALVVAAGALGNVANAWAHQSGHIAVGASTAVFGAVGALGGTGAGRLRLRGARGWRAFVPVAAALALLSLLGTGAQTDVWAHAFGLAAGAALGLALSASGVGRPGWVAQIGLALAAAAAVGLAWQRALAA